jgi:putative DNA primase/helicase
MTNATVADESLWRSALAETKHGVRANEANASLFLRCSEHWRDRIRYNVFIGQLEWRPKPQAPYRPLADHDAVSVQEELQRREGVSFSPGVLHLAMDHAGHQNEHHPVREYLDSIEWDGEPRLDSWMTTYLGANPTPVNAAIGRWWMISAVARAQRPGCKADSMIVLEGPQGLGKSTALSILGGEWYSETLSDLRHGKDAYQDLSGSWIVEIAELDAIRGAASSRIKSFLSTARDKYRPSFGRRSTYHPRHCVFAGSTNELQWIDDPTGARRFWPVRCRRLDRDGLMAIRDQLWAEARDDWGAKEAWWPTTREDVAMLAEAAERRRTADPWEQELWEWLEGKRLVGEAVTTKDALKRIDMPAHKATKHDEMRMGRVLRTMGWERTLEGRHRQRVWKPRST